MVRRGDDTPDLLRAIARSTHAQEFKHDVIFNAAADELDQLRESNERSVMSTTIDENVSYRAQIEALEVGECIMRGARFDADETLKHIPREYLRTLRLGMQPTVHRIQDRTGRKFSVETFEGRTSSRDIAAVLMITRTE
jgi:hypothetical protein